MTGKQFGKLKVISWLRKNGRIHWRCVCDCGKTSIVSSGHLITGHTKSCGCLVRRDLTGMRFGNLVVLQRSNKVSKQRTRFWLCKCEVCGNRIEVRTDALTGGRARSCGCKAWNWRGRIIDKRGYVSISIPEHPYANNGYYVLEHRLVMEDRIGRYLKPEEIIHHLNGIKGDNRIENLRLFCNHKEHNLYHRSIRALYILLMRIIVRKIVSGL